MPPNSPMPRSPHHPFWSWPLCTEQAGRESEAAHAYHLSLQKKTAGQDQDRRGWTGPGLRASALLGSGPGHLAALGRRLRRSNFAGSTRFIRSARWSPGNCSKPTTSPRPFLRAQGRLATLPLRGKPPWAPRSRCLCRRRLSLPITASDGLFFVNGNDLTCREAATGKRRWVKTLSHSPTWIVRHADAVVAAGPDGIQCLALADGHILWELQRGNSRMEDGGWKENLRMEDRGWRIENEESNEPQALLNSQSSILHPLSSILHPSLRDPLTGYHLAGSRLFFFQGERRLVALDTDSGRVLWSRWAPGAEVEPLDPGGRFWPFYHAGEEWLVAQTSAGKLWVLDSQSGRLVHQAGTSPDPWPRPPKALDERRIILVPDADKVILFDPAARKGNLDAPRPEAHDQRRGSPVPWRCPVAAAADGRLAARRLDPLTGQPQWCRAISTEPVDLGRAAQDPEAVYFVSRQAVHARSLEDGHSLWTFPVQGSPGPWRTVVIGDRLIVLPLQAERELPGPWVSGGYLVTIPLEVEWGPLPVWICDAKKGQVLQRLAVQGEGFPAVVQSLDRGAAIGLPGKMVELVTSERP